MSWQNKQTISKKESGSENLSSSPVMDEATALPEGDLSKPQIMASGQHLTNFHLPHTQRPNIASQFSTAVPEKKRPLFKL
jgi:hypothetical protein